MNMLVYMNTDLNVYAWQYVTMIPLAICIHLYLQIILCNGMRINV